MPQLPQIGPIKMAYVVAFGVARRNGREYQRRYSRRAYGCYALDVAHVFASWPSVRSVAAYASEWDDPRAPRWEWTRGQGHVMFLS